MVDDVEAAEVRATQNMATVCRSAADYAVFSSTGRMAVERTRNFTPAERVIALALIEDFFKELRAHVGMGITPHNHQPRLDL